MQAQIIALILLIFWAHALEAQPLVTTPLGKISGQLKSTQQGKWFQAFEGIPYAKPPLGPLRFQNPKAFGPWHGIWHANFLTMCSQTLMTQPNNVHENEDCLYLNIYVPTDAKNLDVLVHIHGGGFMYGSGHAYANPEYFLDKDFVFVTLNYRLGIFGFLSTNDNAIPGNFGLKDQVLALQWIKDNVEYFGGNPASVTLTGLSSGGASVQLHYMSKMSEGLFQRGFSQSGSALNYFALQEDPLMKAKRIGGELGCPTDTTTRLSDCLKQRPVRELLLGTAKLFGYKFFPHSPLGPVLEQEKPTAFLSKNPFYLLAKGQIQDLPWLVSVVSHEGLFPAAFLNNDLEEVNQNWGQISPFLLDFNSSLGSPLLQSTAQELKDRYIDGAINSETFSQLIKLFSDRVLVDIDTAVKWQAKRNKSPVYLYNFAWIGDHSVNGTVAHGEDAQYFFHYMFGRTLSPNELKMKEMMMSVLVSFVQTGRPKLKDLEWDPVRSKGVTFLNITSIEQKKNKIENLETLAPVSFWKSLGLLENQNLVLIKDEL